LFASLTQPNHFALGWATHPYERNAHNWMPLLAIGLAKNPTYTSQSAIHNPKSAIKLPELIMFLYGFAHNPFAAQALGEDYDVAGAEGDLMIRGLDGHLAFQNQAGFLVVILVIER
jgi:hypothetical protein